ncbi:MAG: hypothetical protein KH274_02760 [Veillonella sp. oral taxon 780]|nr:hypothetical protein [Veillonella sp. oral taxon 780]
MMDMPYFLENEEWYTEHRDERGRLKFKLTEKAPKKAIDSYKEYHEMLKYAEENNIDL